MEPRAGRRRRRLPSPQPRSSGCSLFPEIRDDYITKMLCRGGVRYVKPDCGHDTMEAPPMKMRSVGLTPATTGFTSGIGVLLLLLIIILIVWLYRWCSIKRSLKRAAEAEDKDVEQLPKSALLHQRRRRRLRRWLHMKQQHVHFNDNVDVSEIHSMSDLTSMTSSSSSAPYNRRRPFRPGTPWALSTSPETDASGKADSDPPSDEFEDPEGK